MDLLDSIKPVKWQWLQITNIIFKEPLINMSKVHCMYCGAQIDDRLEFCPQCQAPSHYQQRGSSLAKTKKFILFFILLSLFVTAMILWLPR